MADQKLTALPLITTRADDDLIYIVTDPGGTPVSEAIEVSDLMFGWKEVSVNLTNAQLLAMFTTPVQIVPAGGANTLIQLLSSSIAVDNAAGVYTGGGNLSLTVNAVAVVSTLTAALFTADAAASKARYFTLLNAQLTSTAVNTALILSNAAADFGGGNAANKATVKAIYRYISTLPV